MDKDVSDDAGNYVLCMTQINDRFTIFDHAVKEFVQMDQVLLGPAESAFVQLRKSYETLVFASMAGNLPRMAATWKRFQKEWRLADIVKRIKKHNDDFLPHTNAADKIAGVATGNLKLVSDDKPYRIDEKKLIRQHGRLGKLLHARNPFDEKIDYRSELLDAISAKTELKAALSHHVTWLGKDHDVLVTKMDNGEGKAVCTPLRRIYD